MTKKINHYVEIVNGKVRRPNVHFSPTISLFRKATDEEIKSAKTSFTAGKCDHTLFHDEAGWMYDERVCNLCGKLIGLI